ncbi:hypothetical protein Tdes44962_MAKER09421 [Teratosphaeria destructans]|uniref:PD-(D/E)XK nuclease-like domain-containing protein n=1 Tax=Teratosphaeria destructans TaxID=418781 RepID=A0A9W7STH5_9PEZI|nr:hypothetical protein Tdes44962_MAKER09421 [Teratosphaeria destructans]
MNKRQRRQEDVGLLPEPPTSRPDMIAMMTMDDVDDNDGEDDQPTPTAPRRRIRDVRPLASPAASMPAMSDELARAWYSQRSSQSSSSSCTSGKRSRRTPSPTKLAELSGITEENISTLARLPVALRGLVQAAKQHAAARHIVDAASQETAARLSEDLDGEHQLFAPDSLPDFPLPLAELTGIVETACENVRRGRSEPAWNMSVHYPLLDIARRTCSVRDEVSVEVLTSVSIEPPTLISQSHGSRKVDFGICLLLDPAIITTLQSRDISTLNQTLYTPIRYAPLSISIETKPEDAMPLGKVQLATWLQAQTRKLRHLLSQTGRPNALSCALPPLPLLLVHGHEWTFLVYEDRGNREAVVWTKVVVGSTATVLGAYQVVRFLQCLMRWTAGEFRMWWHESILRYLAG